MKVIAVANQKGGVAKTTSVVNIAHALYREGARVVAIDCDPQGSLTMAMGISQPDLHGLDQQGRTLYYALADNRPLRELVIERVGRPALIPACLSLGRAEIVITRQYGRERVLRERMPELGDHYDVAILDCPPHLGFLTSNALVAADAVLIPCKTDYLSVMGLGDVLSSIEEARVFANTALEIMGIVPTIYSATTSNDKGILDLLRRMGAEKGLRVFDPVHQATVFNRAALEGRAAIELAPNAPGIGIYVQIAQEIMGKEGVKAA